MSQVPPATRNVRVTAFFALAGVLLAAAASVIGIGDNPPGLALAYAASASFVLALAHPWRSPRRWFRLFVGSFLGGFASAILHNFPEVYAQRAGTDSLLGGACGVVGVTLFLLAVLVAPSAILVGLGGWVVTLVRNRIAPQPTA